MSTASHAIHAIRNDLAPILFFAELARDGDKEAEKLAIAELLSRLNAIHDKLDALGRVIRDQRATGARPAA